MAIWAIADLHLSFGIPNKEMDLFGPQWAGHAKRIEENWRNLIQDDDLVLIAGDISWAMTPEEAKADLDWIGQLPGTKLMIKGNHDFWWTSLSKVKSVLPPSIHLIQNNAFTRNQVSCTGAKLWDTPEYHFNAFIDFRENPKARKPDPEESSPQHSQKIFDRELMRLETGLKALDPNAKTRIVMTHYPPIGPNLDSSRTSALLEKYRVTICIFGHLHNIKQGLLSFGNKNGVEYRLTSCDYLNFMPIKILDNCD